MTLPSRVTAILILGMLSVFMFAPEASAQFETRTSAQVRGIPWSIAVGDFNHDGKQDLAIADCYYIWIYLGNGDGSFERPIRNTVGTCPISVAAADLNHDGTLDLVVADSVGTLYLLTGKGDGNFAISPFVLAVDPVFVGLADVNGDNELDLIVMASSLQPIGVYLNQGNGVFARHPIQTDVSFTSAVAWGDFNHDGKLDLVVGYSDQVAIWFGNGNGKFHPGPTYTVQPEIESLAVADFRGIGTLDIAAADLLTNTGIGVLLGNGDGTFQAPVFYQCESPTFVVAADVNGDGKKDLVATTTSRAQGGVRLLRGNGDGTFQSTQTYPTGTYAYSIAVGDMNGDQTTDLLVGSSASAFEVDELLNTGAAHFSPTTPLSFPSQFVGTTSSALATTVTNSSATALEISSVKLQGPSFTMNTNCGGSLAPHKECSVQATFTPQAAGPAHGTVTLKDSASSKPQVIELQGAGTFVKLSPPQLSFPPQEIGTQSQPLQFQIVNTGNTPVTVITITINGKNPFDFLVTDACFGRQIPPGGECAVTVTFTPNLPGLRQAEINVDDDGGGRFETEIVTGTGT